MLDENLNAKNYMAAMVAITFSLLQISVKENSKQLHINTMIMIHTKNLKIKGKINSTCSQVIITIS